MESINIVNKILSNIYKNEEISNLINIYAYAPQNRYVFKFAINKNNYIIKLVEKKLDLTRINTVNCMKIAKNHLGSIVPGIYYDGTYKKYDYIIMDYIEGVMLVNVWDGINVENKKIIKKNLYNIIETMRNIEFNFIGSIKSIDKEIIAGPVTDYNIIEGKNINKWDRGPFLNIEEWLISGLSLEINNKDDIRSDKNNDIINNILKLIDYLKTPHKLFNGKSIKFVLSHGDFDIYNIIVDNDNFNIKGIIDWEYSGSYPIYYEYIKRNLSNSKIKEVFEIIVEKNLLEIEYIKHNINKDKTIKKINFLLNNKT